MTYHDKFTLGELYHEAAFVIRCIERQEQLEDAAYQAERLQGWSEDARKWRQFAEVDPLVCPGCGNTDAEDMTLWTTDLETNRFRCNNPEATPPTFMFSKNVDSQTSEDPDEIECDICGMQWIPHRYQYDYA